MKKHIRILFGISRLFVGLVFVYSGLVKGIDPLGSAYKFNDYLGAAGFHQMDTIPLLLSFLLSGTEFMLGIALITGAFMRLTAWTALCFMLFFSVLTLVLAIFNPVTDCGCFGDAIKLTNWQTFYKNLVLLVPVLFLFFNRKSFVLKSPGWLQWAFVGSAVLVFCSFSIHSYRHLPDIDFLPYSVGSNIPAKMKAPDNAPKDKYQTILIYKNKKTGDLKDFDMNNYPWQDTLTWAWVETKSVLVEKGYEPPIHDFAITDAKGANITDTILERKGLTYLLVSYNINKANLEGLARINKFALYNQSLGFNNFFAVTASSAVDVNKISSRVNLYYNFATADETALKTVIRSNPGIVVFKNGVVVAKYHYNDFKDIVLGDDSLDEKSLYQSHKNADIFKVMASIATMAVMLLLFWSISLYMKIK